MPTVGDSSLILTPLMGTFGQEDDDEEENIVG
jgi:hypothetical protein